MNLRGVGAWCLFQQAVAFWRSGVPFRPTSRPAFFPCAKWKRPPCSVMKAAGHSGGVGTPVNRLAEETSPYLLEHADNPVDWYPWGEEAFAKARAEDKPIFLSGGYSTCHWCHVMERESFESVAVARVLNAHFVPVKVDREERPDVDQVYMSFVEATTGGGGWPMSVWLTPDLKPFVGSTYFPEGRFVEVLQMVADKWIADRPKVVDRGDKVIAALRDRLARQASAAGDPAARLESPETLEALLLGVRALDSSHDDVLGGWPSGPGGLKFPQPSRLNFLLRAGHLLQRRPGGGGDADAGAGAEAEADDSSSSSSSVLAAQAMDMVLKNLDAMAAGGVYERLCQVLH